MKRRQKWKRFLAALLAVIMLAGNFVIQNPMTSYASVVMATKNLWKGGPAVLYQKERKYFYRFKTMNPESEKYTDVFCIAPFNHMFNGHVVDGREYDISAFPDAVLSQADFEKLALICHWYEEKGPQNDVRYAAAQTSIWALIDRTWDVNGEAVNVAASHLTMDPGAFKAAFKDVRQYVDDNTTDPNFSSGKNPLPAWCGTSPLLAEPQNMVNKDGVYELELDISKMPQLGKLDWKFPEGEGWKKSVSGRTMTFTYSGKGEPSGTIWADVPASLRNIVPNSSKLTVYLPRLAQDQPMVSGGIRFNQLYINIGNGSLVPPTESGAPGGPTVEIFRHQETFESNYHIDLEKFCAETGLHLEGSTFEVLEAFDHGQLGNGEDGTVSGEFMNPSPWSGFKVCRKITTDENGHASHSDYKEYEYNKTYCGGHPEPEYLEVPEAEEGNEEAAAEAEAIEAENERLRAEWEALCQLCEEETDFHSEEEGVALEMMLSDRDETYETFINLKYQYTVSEIQARPGYILHGTHNDDEVVEVIATNASEGGADADIISRRNALEVMTPERTMKIMTGDPWLPGFLSLVRPDEGAADLEDVRTLVVGTPAATPADADEAGPGEVELASPSNVFEERETASPSNASYASPPNAEEGPVDGELFDDRELDGDSLEEGDVEIPGFLYQLHDRRLDGRLSYEIQQRDPIQPLTDGDDPGDEEITVSVSLPEPVEDDVDWVEPGDPDNLSHTFQVYDHRTEGEIHINKRDLELDREDPEGSYGMTQGDATLEGAVYGLYAAKDILHPDGKTGVVFAQNELVSIATTDANGDASFKAITEISDTSAKAENLAHTWIGHPLILGSYYIKEMSRSEGYELSVTGIDLSESNRKGTGTTILSKAGSVEVTALTSEPDNNDGTWNAFAVTNYKTEEGYDVRISGYPEGAKIHEYTQEIRKRPRRSSPEVLMSQSGMSLEILSTKGQKEGSLSWTVRATTSRYRILTLQNRFTAPMGHVTA
ncbi:MAG: hypothetical protein ACLTKI_00445 [Lachnospiraceae bacterium]